MSCLFNFLEESLKIAAKFRMVPDRGLMDRKLAGVKGKKDRLTYAFTTNADGSEKLPPFIIGKAKKPRAFKKKSGEELGFYYRNNATAWMTTVLYQEWILDWDEKLRRKNRKIILFQDNFSGHVVPNALTNIKVVNFSPNLTSHVQPCDQGIIRTFKSHYRRLFMQRALDRYDDDISPATIYQINQLEAMRIAELAWEAVKETAIYHCWVKSGILPTSLISAKPSSTSTSPTAAHTESTKAASLSESDPLAEAEKGLSDVLDELQDRGALQKANRINVEELINHPDEQILIDLTTDEEIRDAVLNRRENEQQMDANGGDDGSDGPEFSPPTRREALHAASTLQQFLMLKGDKFSCQMESLIAAFGRNTRLEETHHLRDTEITAYFPQM